MEKIAVIDDDFEIRDLIRLQLFQEGYDVQTYSCSEQFLEHIDEHIDLIILDVMMPKLGGIELCRRIREHYRIPIIFLTAKSMEEDLIEGMSVGADDYITKPFSSLELLTRIKTLLRRYLNYGSKRGGMLNAVIVSRKIRLDTTQNSVEKDNEKIILTEREYNILKLLMTHPGCLFSMEAIFERVWEETYFYSCSNTVMVHIRNLRKKIEEDPDHPLLIENVWGKGYRFNENKTEEI